MKALLKLVLVVVVVVGAYMLLTNKEAPVSEEVAVEATTETAAPVADVDAVATEEVAE
ncbi:MAG: hypothetical protein JXQ74_00740 [Alphaproteobacteria bacterium]|nr:hypothetical protein [Alphaproteobacteria bacterium]